MKDKAALLKAIDDRSAVIGIVGMGYVGLPLALEFARKRFKVLGFDIDQNKNRMLNIGQSYIKHIPSSSVSEMQAKGGFEATSDFSRIAETDAVLICVPTPLGRHWEPDISYIISTAESIAPFLKIGHLVVLESTTYPGTTEQDMAPVLEKLSGLKAGEDFWVAFSPEREDPNNKEFSTSTIPKVVGGMTRDSGEIARHLYNQIIVKTVPVANCATAESTKLLENIFRSVNIALVNELKMVFTQMGIDVWEVIEAAATKPFGYMPFYPGPGLGGHCIPIDPFYLTWKAREFGVPTRFIELAGEINTSMPNYVVHRTSKALNAQRKSLNGSKVLIVGLAYKGDVDDMRESPSLTLIELFEQEGAQVDYYDPYIPVIPSTREHAHFTGRKSIELENLSRFDVAVISTKHNSVDHTRFIKDCPLVVDTRRAIVGDYDNLYRA